MYTCTWHIIRVYTCSVALCALLGCYMSMCVCIHVCKCVYVHVHVHTHVNVYIFDYIDMYVHMVAIHHSCLNVHTLYT